MNRSGSDEKMSKQTAAGSRSNDKNENLKELMGTINGVYLKEKHGGVFRFPLYLTQEMCNTSLEDMDLNLSIRAYHCLKRAGYNTIGDVTDAIERGDDLSRIRGCGINTLRDIKERLFFFQYNAMKQERRETYLTEVIAINMR